jgi:hypothetical protein
MKVVLNLALRSVEFTIDLHGAEYSGEVLFNDLDEWRVYELSGSHSLFFHLDYAQSKNFSSQDEWVSSIIQCYWTDDENFNVQLIKEIILEL